MENVVLPPFYLRKIAPNTTLQNVDLHVSSIVKGEPDVFMQIDTETIIKNLARSTARAIKKSSWFGDDEFPRITFATSGSVLDFDGKPMEALCSAGQELFIEGNVTVRSLDDVRALCRDKD